MLPDSFVAFVAVAVVFVVVFVSITLEPCCFGASFFFLLTFVLPDVALPTAAEAKVTVASGVEPTTDGAVLEATAEGVGLDFVVFGRVDFGFVGPLSRVDDC